MPRRSTNISVLEEYTKVRYIKWTTISSDNKESTLNFLTGLIYCLKCMNKEYAENNIPLQIGYTATSEDQVMQIYLTVEKECRYKDEALTLIVMNYMARLLGASVLDYKGKAFDQLEDQGF